MPTNVLRQAYSFLRPTAVTLVAMAVVFLQFSCGETQKSEEQGAVTFVTTGQFSELNKTYTAVELISKVYDSTQVVGIAVSDHNRMTPFDHVVNFLKERGLDPKLKVLVVEDSSELASLYAQASVEPIDYKTFEPLARSRFKGITTTTEYLVNVVLPVIREINLKRQADPILVIPIDSMDSEAALEIFAPRPKPRIKVETNDADISGLNARFINSIDREKKTAENFKRMIVDAYPGRKAIVVYHAAHIFKNLSAVGLDLTDQGYVYKRDVLPWMAIAQELLPELQNDGFKVIACDYASGKAIEGAYTYPEWLKIPESSGARGVIWPAVAAKASELFKPKTFLFEYRQGTVEVIDPGLPIFDAVIVER